MRLLDPGDVMQNARLAGAHTSSSKRRNRDIGRTYGRYRGVPMSLLGIRRLSFGTETALVLIAWVVVITAVLGGIGLAASNRIARRSALGAVEIAADERHDSLLLRLQRQHDRQARLIAEVQRECSLATDARACAAERLEDLRSAQRATGAVLVLPGEPPILAGDVAHALAGEPPEPPPMLARFHRGAHRSYVVRVDEAGASLALRFDLSVIDEHFGARPGLGGSGETFLLDGGGYLLSPARFAMPSGNDQPIATPMVDRCLAGERGEMRGVNYRGTMALAAFRPLPEIGGGCVMAQVDEAESVAPVARLERTTGLAAALFALVAVALSLIVARIVSGAMHKLAKRVVALKDGDFDGPFPVSGPAELRLLGERFEEMTRSLKESRARAEQAIRARDDVLAMVSHDLKNPLGVVILGVSALELGHGDPKRVTATIRRAAMRMQALIEELLDAQKIEAGQLVLDREPNEVGGLLEEAREAQESLALDKSVQLEVVESDDRQLLTDRSRLLQVLANLVGNAIKFTPAGGRVTLGAHVVDGEATFMVRDTGPGIPADRLPHVFDRYWQAQETRSAGSGLGLYIAHEIVQAHGGRLWVESEVGVGSVFRFTVPVAQASERQLTR
jgi:signal transduction histidine kinase